MSLEGVFHGNQISSPGYYSCSTTGRIDAGCSIVTYTSSGRGSVYGSKPAPSIKITTKTPMCQRIREGMDVDAGGILVGCGSEHGVGERVAVASGERSLSEAQGCATWISCPGRSAWRCENSTG